MLGFLEPVFDFNEGLPETVLDLYAHSTTIELVYAAAAEPSEHFGSASG